MRKVLLAFFLIYIFCFPILSETVLNQTFTGQQIYNTASFPGSTKSLSGTSLIVNFSSGGPYALLLLPVLAPNILSNTAIATVNVTVNFNRNIADYDPYFAITDGLNAVGAGVYDNSTGTSNVISLQQPTPTTISNLQGVTNATNTGYPATGASASVSFAITINPQSAAQASVTFYSSTISATTSVIMDVSRGLSFLVTNDTNDTTYRIDSVSFQINGSVIPEASTLSLFLLTFTLALFLKGVKK